MTHFLQESRFLRGCRREKADCTPVWLMRQAGRYMPEYRALRQKYSLLTLCKTPELAAEVTLQPIRRFGFDAAIVFADILLTIEAMGLQLEFAKGEGPVIANPISSEKEVDAITTFDVEQRLGFVSETVRIVIKELQRIPLIGFAGAPFTIERYMIEGGNSRHFLKTKQLMYQSPRAWQKLMEKISQITVAYLQMQIQAGASAVQLFDSWAGVLSPDDYKNFVIPYSRHVLKSLSVPTIHFSTGTSSYLKLICAAGGDVICIDWKIPLNEARKKIGTRAIQGNLDPASLLKKEKDLITDIRTILDLAAGAPGHIFNLGHGVFPETPVENVELLV